MADLSDIQSAQSVKVIGSDATGLETTPVKSTATGDLQTVDLVDNGGVSGVIAVANTAIPIRVGGSNLANRKRLTFINVGNAVMYWSYSASLTGAGNGAPIFRNQPVSDSWGPNTTIYIIAPSGSGSLWVGEGA